jgi:hypothetical protein
MNIGESKAAQALLRIVTGQHTPTTLDEWTRVADDAGLLARQSNRALGAGMNEDRVRTLLVGRLRPVSSTGPDDWTLDLGLPRRLICEGCGCTDEMACLGGCTWVHEAGEAARCSRCQDLLDDDQADPEVSAAAVGS